jgi:hypothetical protein
MSKKYETRRFRKLHKGRKGRKGYTTRKKMDGGMWRMWGDKLREFKLKINDVPALKEALVAYRNTGTEGDARRDKILEQVREICDQYQSIDSIQFKAQFFLLKQFAVEKELSLIHI